MGKQERFLITLFVIFILILITIGYAIIDFYNDYVCSTTTNIGWYIENNCERYRK